MRRVPVQKPALRDEHQQIEGDAEESDEQDEGVHPLVVADEADVIDKRAHPVGPDQILGDYSDYERQRRGDPALRTVSRLSRAGPGGPDPGGHHQLRCDRGHCDTGADTEHAQGVARERIG